MIKNSHILGYPIEKWAIFFRMANYSKYIIKINEEKKIETFMHPIALEIDKVLFKVITGQIQIPGIDLSLTSRTEIVTYISNYIEPVTDVRRFNPTVLLLCVLHRLYDEDFKPIELLLGTGTVKEFVVEFYMRMSNNKELDPIRIESEKLLDVMLNPNNTPFRAKNILNRYKEEFKGLISKHYNSLAHDTEHIIDVYSRAIYLNNKYNLQIEFDEIAVASIFHDMFESKDRKNHHQIGHDYIMASIHPMITLGSKDKQKRIAVAILEHRASYTGEYSSSLSELIATADREKPNILEIIKRAYLYQKDTNPNSTHREKIEVVKKHLVEKFGRDGYTTYTHMYLLEHKPELLAMYDTIDKIQSGKLKINIGVLKDKLLVTLKR